MTKINFTQLSKTISHALRHAPWLYELELDEAGWTPVEALLDGLRRHRRAWRRLDEDNLRAMMARPGKQRFEMRDNRIRALYGHSIAMKIHKEPALPPSMLYHGTAPQTAERIAGDGLRPMKRQYVHLSADRKTAYEVGRRKARQPVILQIDAATAHAEGIAFYRGNEMIWLTDYVPPQFIRSELIEP